MPIARLVDRSSRRGRWGLPASSGAAALRMREVLLQLWRDPATRTLALAGAAAVVSNFALAAWTPSFFICVHGLSLIEVGIGMGLGPFGVGMLSDALAPAENSLRYGLLASLSPVFVGGLSFWRAGSLYALASSRRPKPARSQLF